MFFLCAPRAFSYMLGIVGISGKERKMGMEGFDRIAVFAPQFGIGKDRLKGTPRGEESVKIAHTVSGPTKSLRKLDQRPASALGVAELVGKQWSHHVVNTTKTHAVVVFTSPDSSMREERTILRDMLPNPAPVKHHGRPVLHLGKTARDHETGAWKQHLDNRAAHAELNRGHAVDHGAGTKGGGRHGGKYDT